MPLIAVNRPYFKLPNFSPANNNQSNKAVFKPVQNSVDSTDKDINYNGENNRNKANNNDINVGK